MSDLGIPELEVPFVFRRRPSPVPPDLRPEWRIAVILLVLRRCCQRGRSSFARLHVLNWAVRSSESQRALQGVLIGTTDPDTITVRVEPSLNRAVNLARISGLINIVNGSHVELTLKGTILADDLLATGDLFTAEKQFLASIERRVTEDLVSRMLRKGGGA